METEIKSSVEETTTDKKQVIRSAAYPFITIKDAVEIVNNIYKYYPKNGVINRNDVAAIHKSSYLNREIGACTHYGLLKLEKGDGYSITELFQRIYKPLPDSNEKAEALLTAFKNPKLYSELIRSYNHHAVPAELSTVLFRKHGIAEKVSESAAKIFFENARFVGAIDDNRILNVDTINLPPNSEETTTDSDSQNTGSEDQKTDKVAFVEAKSDHQGKPPAPKEQETDADEEQNYTLNIRLTSKKTAKLIHPAVVTKKDIAIIRKHLDVLEFTIVIENEEET
jgi:hypothetical protein